MITTLKQIEEFVNENSFDIMTDLEEEEQQLTLCVAWCDSGYRDDEIHRDNLLDELFDIQEEINEKFNVNIEDDERTIWDDEKESIIITLKN